MSDTTSPVVSAPPPQRCWAEPRAADICHCEFEGICCKRFHDTISGKTFLALHSKDKAKVRLIYSPGACKRQKVSFHPLFTPLTIACDRPKHGRASANAPVHADQWEAKRARASPPDTTGMRERSSAVMLQIRCRHSPAAP